MKPDQYTKDFEEFWKRYPARWQKEMCRFVKRKKKPAFLVWKKLPIEIRKICLSRVHLIAKNEGSKSSIRDCVTWLNQDGWDEINIDKEPMGLPKEMIENLLKKVPDANININNERNRQMNLLKE